MDVPSSPPFPPRPELPEKPRGSWLALFLVVTAGVAGAVIMTFLTLGFFGPFLLLALAIFAIIGLQYLLWGWWFERIYRSQPAEEPEIADRDRLPPKRSDVT
jgi:CHASE2 domain-containing sensor protein